MIMETLFYSIEEHLGGLECRNVVFRDDQGCVLSDVAGCLLSALLEDEATKTAEINVLLVAQRVLNLFHECFNNSECCSLVDASLFRYLAYDFCFSHFLDVISYSFSTFGVLKKGISHFRPANVGTFNELRKYLETFLSKKDVYEDISSFLCLFFIPLSS